MADELKLVRCGCGGEAEVLEPSYTHCYVVQCSKCGIRTPYMNSDEEAINAWNRAMSAGRDEIAITKGYWMTTYDGLHCSVCNYKCETTALPEVCPHCGTRLTRW